MVNAMRLSIFLTLVLFITSTLFASVSINQLEKEIGKRLSRVEQFVEIEKLAHEAGIKEVYLFGGTASAWAHYVYTDLKREDGDSKYPKSRFNYDYTEIFRANQDMDILIDGTGEQAEKLEAALQSRFQFFQGKKSVFEVRLKNSARGDKDAITDPDFYNQNTDSHSTGLIQLVGDDKNVVQDTKEQQGKLPQFLKDVYEHRLHFYYDHEKHVTTKRFKEGKNPEIFAVIRNLIKMFQYELEPDSESLGHIKRVIQNFSPFEVIKGDSYVPYWLENHGPKLFQNAVNLEYAWNTLEKLGLREKLIKISDRNKKESLGWWLSKEPLRSFEVGKGKGRTAKELGIEIVGHETNSFSAFESITKSKSGEANVFISREGEDGEQAAFGKGFYTAKGKNGARNTGITIRFQVNPLAREGSDFSFVNEGRYLLFHNKNALKVIHENLSIAPIDYLRKLAKGELLFDSSDKGVAYNVRRRVEVSVSKITKKEKSELRQLLKTTTSKTFALELLEFLPEVYERSPEAFLSYLERGLFTVSDTRTDARVIKLFKESFDEKKFGPYSKTIFPLLQLKVGKLYQSLFVKEFLKSPESKNYPELFSTTLKSLSYNELDGEVIFTLLTDQYWREHHSFHLPYLIGHLSNLYSEQLEEFLENPISLTYEDELIAYIRESRATGFYRSLAVSPYFKMNKAFYKKIVDQDSTQKSPIFKTVYGASPSFYKDEIVDHIRYASDLNILLEVSFENQDWAPVLMSLYEKFNLFGRKSSLTEFIPLIKTLTLPYIHITNEQRDLLLRSKVVYQYFQKAMIFHSPLFQGKPEIIYDLFENQVSKEERALLFAHMLIANSKSNNIVLNALGKERSDELIEHLILDFGEELTYFSKYKELEPLIGPLDLPSEALTSGPEFKKHFFIKRIKRLGRKSSDTNFVRLAKSVETALSQNIDIQAHDVQNMVFSSFEVKEQSALLYFLKYLTSPIELKNVMPTLLKGGTEELRRWAADWAQNYGSDSKYRESFEAGESIRFSLAHLPLNESCLQSVGGFLR